MLLTIFLAPLLQIAILLYVLLPLHLNRVPWRMARAFRLLRRVEPWSMMEVFMIGILVAVAKLLDMAQIVPGLALWAFVLLIAASSPAPSPRSIPRPSGSGAEERRVSAAPATALSASCASCHDCGFLCPRAAAARRTARAARAAGGAARAQAEEPRAHLGARDRGRHLLPARPTSSRS